MTTKTAEPKAPALPAREHKVGCPKSRVESTQAKDPRGRQYIVVRCIECGGQLVKRVRPASSITDEEEMIDGEKDGS